MCWAWPVTIPALTSRGALENSHLDFLLPVFSFLHHMLFHRSADERGVWETGHFMSHDVLEKESRNNINLNIFVMGF